MTTTLRFRADRVKGIRLSRGLGVVEFAKQMDVSPSTISRWENGLREPSKPLLRKLAHLSNVKYMDFFESRRNGK